MSSRTPRTIVAGAGALVIVASQALAQSTTPPPRRAIEQVSGSVYTAINNNHRTVFLVTPEGIILGDPINADFSRWLKAELAIGTMHRAAMSLLTQQSSSATRTC